MRRQGAKRSHLDVDIPRGSAEVVPSDTLLDSDLFESALVYLEAVQLESYLMSLFENHPAQSVIDAPETTGLIQAIADRRGLNYEEVEGQVFYLAGVQVRPLSIDE